MHDKLKSLRDTAEYAEEKLVAATQSLLEELLQEKGMNKSDLAKKMGVSKARISQIFSDNQNFTLRLLAHAFHALGEEIHVGRTTARMEYKSAEPVAEPHELSNCLPIEAKMREISHGFEWLDRQIEIGGQSVRENVLSKADLADLLNEAMQAVMKQSGETKDSRHNRERDHDRATVSDWSQTNNGSNVVPLIRKKVAGRNG